MRILRAGPDMPGVGLVERIMPGRIGVAGLIEDPARLICLGIGADQPGLPELGFSHLGGPIKIGFGADIDEHEVESRAAVPRVANIALNKYASLVSGHGEWGSGTLPASSSAKATWIDLPPITAANTFPCAAASASTGCRHAQLMNRAVAALSPLLPR